MTPTENHYTPDEIAAAWHLDPDSVRKIFRDEPGVLKFGRAVSTRTKRAYTSMRIPMSVLDRVYRRMTDAR